MKKKKLSSKTKMAIGVAVGLAYLPIGVVLELTKKYNSPPRYRKTRRRRR